MFTTLGNEFTQRGWDDAEAATKDAPQRLEAAGFKWTKATDDWKSAIDKAVRDTVIPKWSRRAGPEGVKLFNEILAPITGYQASS
jgi:TRAP-type C4-dicarboxylate transport system substrate-binding protein